MRRLFSTFAHGAPGAGLLLMRVAAGCALLFHGVATLTAGVSSSPVAFHIACVALGVLLALGLWTPAVGALAAIVSTLHGFFSPADAGCYVLLATLCAALALLGPGAWSVDARLFGWRRVEIRNGNAHGKGPEPRPKEPHIDTNRGSRAGASGRDSAVQSNSRRGGHE